VRKSLERGARAVAAATAIGFGTVSSASAADTLSMQQHESVLKAFEGKRVAWIPSVLAAPMMTEWTRIMKDELEPLGITLTVHDPNLDSSVQVQMMSALIAEKPALIVVNSNTVGLLARQIKQAQDAGIPVIQVQQGSTTQSDVFIAPDFYDVGFKMATEVGEVCSAPGMSGKVAIIEGETSAQSNIDEVRGITETFKTKYPSINVVASQSAHWNANQAFDITSTLLQQHPDLCGVIGAWATMSMGIAKAVKQAGNVGKTIVVTNGEASREECNYVEQGLFHLDVAYNATRNAYTIIDMIRFVLNYYGQGGHKPPELKVTLFTPLTLIKQGDGYHKDLCFDTKALH
jgi:ribose transport system substrate-binding protein